MIADGPRVCKWCSTAFEFSSGLLVAVRWSASPCQGCERWHGILERAKAAAAEKAESKDPALQPVDLTSLSAIHERVMAGLQRREPEAFDHAKAAAGDRE